MATRVSDLDTPALLVDLDTLEANLDRAAAYTKASGLRLRPHTKTQANPMFVQRSLDRVPEGASN